MNGSIKCGSAYFDDTDRQLGNICYNTTQGTSRIIPENLGMRAQEFGTKSLSMNHSSVAFP